MQNETLAAPHSSARVARNLYRFIHRVVKRARKLRVTHPTAAAITRPTPLRKTARARFTLSPAATICCVLITSTPNGIPRAPTLVKISGLPPGEYYYGMDIRPANGQLYLLGGSSRIYVVNPATNTVALVGSGQPFNPALNGSFRSISFDPTTDRLRLVTNIGQNLSINPDNGTVVSVDPQFFFAPNDPNFGRTPGISAIAYANNYAGALMTKLYGIDLATKIFGDDQSDDGRSEHDWRNRR
jgi:hypothetical protein